MRSQRWTGPGASLWAERNRSRLGTRFGLIWSGGGRKGGSLVVNLGAKGDGNRLGSGTGQNKHMAMDAGIG